MPFLNLRRPAKMVYDGWLSTSPLGSRRSAPLIGWWWGVFLVNGFFGPATGSSTTSLSGLHDQAVAVVELTPLDLAAARFLGAADLSGSRPVAYELRTASTVGAPALAVHEVPGDACCMPTTGVQDSSSAYASVPEVEPDAEVDPHWLSLRGGALLPSVYMPPPMAGEHGSWMRAVALILIGVFVAATTAGICLTYGPPHHLF